MRLGLQYAVVSALFAGLPVVADAAVIFSQFTIDEVSTQGQLQSGSGAASTHIGGIAAEAEAMGDLFAIQGSNSETKNFLRVNAATGGAAKLTDTGVIAQQLSNPALATVNLTGGFSYYPPQELLYFGGAVNGNSNDTVLLSVNAGDGTATKISDSADISGLTDHTVMPDGTIAATRAGAKLVGTINPSTGVWTTRLSESQLLAASPGTTSLEPEAIASDPTSGKSYVFAHGDLELFEVPDVNAVTPSVGRLSPPELASADFHDLAVDQYGNLYGLDVTTNNIMIIRSTDGAVFAFPLSNIATALGRPAFAAVPWRGLAARVAGYSQADLFLSSGDSSYGIVRVRFGAVASAVTDWTLY